MPQQTPQRSPIPQQPYAPQQGRYTMPQAAPYPPRQAGPYLPPDPPAPPRKRRGPVRFIALLLAVAILVLGFVKPGFFLKEKRAEMRINRVEVFIPNPTGPEAVVSLVGDLALAYYVEARLYLEKLSQYDTGKMDPEEFASLALNTVTAFENAEKISECLSDAVDLWMACDDVREAPTYKVIHEARNTSALSGLFSMKAYAKGSSPSEDRAQAIIDAFDKGKNGQRIKAVADYLGTDTKHAYAELKMALAMKEGETYQEIAEKATTCIKVAKTLKTAGTVAGLVIAAAPVATGAVASMAAGEMLVTGTGVVVAAVNTGLEVTSTGAMLYHGTDENKVTQLADAVSDSKFMQTVNLVTGVASVGYNVKNVFDSLEKITKTGGGAKELGTLLNTLSSDGKTATDMFGLYSFGLSNLDKLPGPEGAIADKTAKSLVTMITHTGEGGMTVSISDTLIGTARDQTEAVNRLLDELDIPDKGTRDVLDAVVDTYKGIPSVIGVPTDPAEAAPPALVKKILQDKQFIAPDSGKAGLDKTTEAVGSFMKELAESERVPESKPAETPKPTAAPKPTAKPTPKPTQTPAPTASGPKLAGRYSGTLSVPGQIEAYGAVVNLSPTPVYITINDDNSAVFQTTVESTYSYSGFGATMSGSGAATVRQESIPGESIGDGAYFYSFKVRATTTSTTSYSGPMYAGGGGDATTTSQSDYEVMFTARPQADGSVVITGQMTVKPAEEAAGSIDTAISFTCTRT